MIDILNNLHGAAKLMSPNYQARIAELNLWNTRFQKQSRVFLADGELEELRGNVNHLLSDVEKIVAEEHIKSRSVKPAPVKDKPTDAKTIISVTSQLSVDLPKIVEILWSSSPSGIYSRRPLVAVIQDINKPS